MHLRLQSLAYRGFMANIHSRVWASVIVGFRIRNRDIVMNNIKAWPGLFSRPRSRKHV